MSVRGGETAALLLLAGVKRCTDGSQTLDLMCRAHWQKSASTATHKSLLSASWRGFHLKLPDADESHGLIQLLQLDR